MRKKAAAVAAALTPPGSGPGHPRLRLCKVALAEKRIYSLFSFHSFRGQLAPLARATRLALLYFPLFLFIPSSCRHSSARSRRELLSLHAENSIRHATYSYNADLFSRLCPSSRSCCHSWTPGTLSFYSHTHTRKGKRLKADGFHWALAFFVALLRPKNARV